MILDVLTSTTPDPSGLRTMFPFVSVELIVFPFMRMLSTSSCVRPAIAVVVDPRVRVDEPRVIFLAVTAPLETVKLSVLNDAIPFVVVVASSPVIVT